MINHFYNGQQLKFQDKCPVNVKFAARKKNVLSLCAFARQYLQSNMYKVLENKKHIGDLDFKESRKQSFIRMEG